LEYVRVESLQWPPRKYYKLTSKGKETLKSLDKMWKQLTHSVEKITK
jgi:DNA-binding PadR family transcriptional regulator